MTGLREQSSAKGRVWLGRATIVPVLLAGAVLAGCSSAPTIQGKTLQPLLSYSRTTHTVTLEILAGENQTNSGLNFDGAASGSMTITVPVGWTVDVTCINYSTTMTHSCAFVAPGSSTPAFAGAESPDPAIGLRPARSAQFSFVASPAGQYQLVCLVPGHRGTGMWDNFVVSPGGLPKIAGAVNISPSP